MTWHRQRNADGLTLLELVVVFGIMLLLAVIVYTGFQNYVAEQQFQAGVVEVTSLIREVRQRTLAAEDGVAHGIIFGSSTATTVLGPAFDPAADTAVVTELNGLTITPALTGGTIELRFARLSGTPSATGTILLESDRGEASTTLTISGTGIIQ